MLNLRAAPADEKKIPLNEEWNHRLLRYQASVLSAPQSRFISACARPTLIARQPCACDKHQMLLKRIDGCSRVIIENTNQGKV